MKCNVKKYPRRFITVFGQLLFFKKSTLDALTAGCGCRGIVPWAAGGCCLAPRPARLASSTWRLRPGQALRPEPTQPCTRPRATAWVNISSCRTGLRNVRGAPRPGEGSGPRHSPEPDVADPTAFCAHGETEAWRWPGRALGPSVSGRASPHLCFPFFFPSGVCAFACGFLEGGSGRQASEPWTGS